MFTTEPSREITEAAERLRREFDGRVDIGRVERLLADSLDRLSAGALTTMWLPLLAERLTRDRLRALSRAAGATRPGVLFLCVHNAGRSQMAAGWLRALAGDGVDVFSGGSEPGESVNPVAVDVMAEVGIDIASELPQPWTDDVIRSADVVVTMGCGDACPVYPGIRYLDWELEDPAGKDLAAVRPIRDEIERMVRGLMVDLGVSPED